MRCIFGRPGRRRAYVPDACVVRRERLPTGLYLEVAPDLAAEILSPGQNVARLLGKITFYLRSGVHLVWVIDPVTASITVFAPDQEERTLIAGDVLDGGDLLPGFSIAVAAIFDAARMSR